MAPKPVLLEHPSSLAHDTGPHPEQPARLQAIERELAARDWLGYERITSPPADRAQVTAVHAEAHVAQIEAAAAAGGAQLDLDTVISEHSFEAALHAAGGATKLVDLLLDRTVPTGFSVHRPPGHHATADRAMGFCLFNNVAIAARHAVDTRGLERVMILDWDVHHGNGTNDIFYDRREVMFVSIHQWPLYPGTGGAHELGAGSAAGYTVNLPVPPGSGDDAYVSLVEHTVAPLARAFRPELVLLSAGFDAHRDDPLADCTLTEAGYAAMTASMRRVCAELLAPIGGVLEGGYALAALASSLAATLEVLAEEDTSALAVPKLEPHPLAVEARARLADYWPTLGHAAA